MALIENGEINSKEMNQLLHVYLEPMIAANIDYLVLGCSHYPYLIPQINKILPKEIKIIEVKLISLNKDFNALKPEYEKLKSYKEKSRLKKT